MKDEALIDAIFDAGEKQPAEVAAVLKHLGRGSNEISKI
jgi:hypothetical protein